MRCFRISLSRSIHIAWNICNPIGCTVSSQFTSISLNIFLSTHQGYSTILNSCKHSQIGFHGRAYAFEDVHPTSRCTVPFTKAFLILTAQCRYTGLPSMFLKNTHSTCPKGLIVPPIPSPSIINFSKLHHWKAMRIILCRQMPT
jgi:hypothetical protein